MLNKVLAFIFGGAVGAFVTYKYCEKKFNAQMEIEVAAIRDSYRKQYGKVNNENNKTKASDIPINDDPVSTVPDVEMSAAKTEYNKFSGKYKSSESVVFTGRPGVMEDIYIIEPDQFGEMYDYSQSFLTYYADGILTDDTDEPIENVDDILGNRVILNSMGAFEPNALHIRDDRRHVDYRIEASVLQYYGDVIGPHE